MRVRETMLAALAMGVVLSCWTPRAHAQTDGITDQLIVSFAPDSAAGRELAAIDLAALEQPAGDPRLLDIAAAWGERLGVPLQLEGLTSGRELLLGIDRPALAEHVAQRVAERDGVVSAQAGDELTGEPRITVTFQADSPFAASIAGGAGIDIAVGQLPLTITVEDVGPASGTLAIDMEGLAAALEERLQADPEIRYVQRNRLLRRYDQQG